MQLFSIGLFELNDDGSERADADGNPIPTYDNEDIRNLPGYLPVCPTAARMHTFTSDCLNFASQCECSAFFSRQREKRLPDGTVLPAGLGGMQDIDAAMDFLFNHPNVGPFIGRQLIQRLVTSNPSPAYIAKVSAAFNGDASGVQGDLRAVLRAILLDPEALASPGTDRAWSKLREPLLRALALLKQFRGIQPRRLLCQHGHPAAGALNQHPLSSPSVFNFSCPAIRRSARSPAPVWWHRNSSSQTVAPW